MKLTSILMFVLAVGLGASAFAADTTPNTGPNPDSPSTMLQAAVTGTITDGSSGEALPGANVFIKGTTQGAISDPDGSYTLEASEGDVLVFSFVGYLVQEVAVGTETVINVALEPDVLSLEEIVVVGYGTQLRVEVTGAISSIDAEDITAIPVATADQALQGRAAGVTVTNNGSLGSSTLNSAVLAGTNPGNFNITTDSCNGISLIISGTCTVVIEPISSDN